MRWLLIIGLACLGIYELTAAVRNSPGHDPLTISQLMWRFFGRHKIIKILLATAWLGLFYHLFIQHSYEIPATPIVQVDDEYTS